MIIAAWYKIFFANPFSDIAAGPNTFTKSQSGSKYSNIQASSMYSLPPSLLVNITICVLDTCPQMHPEQKHIGRHFANICQIAPSSEITSGREVLPLRRLWDTAHSRWSGNGHPGGARCPTFCSSPLHNVLLLTPLLLLERKPLPLQHLLHHIHGLFQIFPSRTSFSRLFFYWASKCFSPSIRIRLNIGNPITNQLGASCPTLGPNCRSSPSPPPTPPPPPPPTP